MENHTFCGGSIAQKPDFFFFCFNVFILLLCKQPVGGFCWGSELAILGVTKYNVTNSFLHQPEQYNYAAIGNPKRSVEKIVGDKGESWCSN
jgi:hypothetical protein